ncbi:hypothetical protein GCM10010349_02910 [Streptomyces flavofungini]|nr:hypothetical protein GCM10010349_02910 [Streptomyces flavofungini]
MLVVAAGFFFPDPAPSRNRGSALDPGNLAGSRTSAAPGPQTPDPGPPKPGPRQPQRTPDPETRNPDPEKPR